VGIDFKKLADGAFQLNASDIHLIQDGPVYMRIDGVMRPVSGATAAREDLESFLRQYMPDRLERHLEERRGSDFAWQPDDRMRFRISAYYERERLRIVLRLIPMRIRAIEELGLPEVVRTIAGWRRGITLMTGVTGSGKTTTLAAMLQQMNKTEHRCIITIEDPIEIVHPNIKSVISRGGSRH
jgi:twitching motility protein PilT